MARPESGSLSLQAFFISPRWPLRTKACVIGLATSAELAEIPTRAVDLPDLAGGQLEIVAAAERIGMDLEILVERAALARQIPVGMVGEIDDRRLRRRRFEIERQHIADQARRWRSHRWRREIPDRRRANACVKMTAFAMISCCQTVLQKLTGPPCNWSSPSLASHAIIRPSRGNRALRDASGDAAANGPGRSSRRPGSPHRCRRPPPHRCRRRTATPDARQGL